MKTKTKQPKASAKAMPTRVVILLDRTGSMSSVKDETIGGFNGYLDGLKDDLTVKAVQFDSQGIDDVFDFCKPSTATRLNSSNYVPRAYTPLYDAIGKTIRDIRESCKGCKVMFVTQTDGMENASKEFTLASVRSLIKECEDRDKWTFAYIGMGLDAWASTQDISVGTQSASNVLNVPHGKDGVIRGYSKLSRATALYSSKAGGQCVASVFGPDEDEIH